MYKNVQDSPITVIKRPKPQIFHSSDLPSSLDCAHSLLFQATLPESVWCCFSISLSFIHPTTVENLALPQRNLFFLWLLVSSWLANTWDLIAWNICDSADFLLCETELSLGYRDTWFSVWTSPYGSLCRSFCLICCSSQGLFLVHCLLMVDFLCTIKYICLFDFYNFKSASSIRPLPWVQTH